MLFSQRFAITLIFCVGFISAAAGQDDLMAYYNKGNKLYNAKNYAKAISYFDSALTINPYFSTAYFKLAYCHYNLEDYKAALHDIERDYAYRDLDNKYFYIKKSIKKLSKFVLILFKNKIHIKISRPLSRTSWPF